MQSATEGALCATHVPVRVVAPFLLTYWGPKSNRSTPEFNRYVRVASLEESTMSIRAWRVGFLVCVLALLGPAASEASVLSAAAAALQPGHYATLSTGLTGADLQPDNSAGSILDWADSGGW